MSKNALRWTEEEYAKVLAEQGRGGKIEVLYGGRTHGKSVAQELITRAKLGIDLLNGKAPTHFAHLGADDSKPAKRRGDPEHQEQKDFITKLAKLADDDPRYKLAVARTFAIPNGGARGKAQAGKLKAEGVRAGVPDLFVAVPVRGRCGLFIEMKSLTGDPSREQREWLSKSFDLGYAAACCRGAREAMIVWRAYVDASL